MISRIMIEMQPDFKHPVYIVADNPNDNTVPVLRYSPVNSFRFGVDPTDANIITMLAAYLHATTPAAVFYTFNTYGNPLVLYAETASSPTSAGVLTPHSWMPDQNYFLANKPITEVQATNAQTGTVWLQRAAATRPDNPPATAVYTGSGVDGWGDNLASLGAWSLPSVTVASPDGHPTWVARANLGIDGVGVLRQSPWLVGPAIAEQTIQYSDHDTGPWSFTAPSPPNPAGFFRIRTSNGEWTAALANGPLANARDLLRGQVQMNYAGQLVPPARFVVPTPFNIRNVNEIQVIFTLHGTVQNLVDNVGSQYVVPWTPTEFMRVTPYTEDVNTSVLYPDITSQVHISSPWGARWAIGLAAQVGGSGGVNQSINLTFMAANGGDADEVAFIEVPFATNGNFGSLIVRTR